MENLKSDLSASIVVFLVALPLCLGISLASGAPLIAGIISGVVGGIVTGFISQSKTSVSGPAAGLTVIVFSAVTSLGDFYSFTVAVVLAGFIQVLLGLFKVGRFGGYFPNSVIKGMLAAIGIILILKQIPHLLGFDSDYMGDESFKQIDGENTFSEIFKAFNYIDLKVLIVSVISIIVLIIWDNKIKKNKYFFETVPAPLFVVLFSVLLNEFVFPLFFGEKISSEHLVNLPDINGVSDLINKINLPHFYLLRSEEIYKIALTLALVSSIETLLSIEAVDKLDPLKKSTNKDKELVAQGIGNITSGFLGGLPMTSVIVRSSANITAGAKSKMAAVFHGLWLLVSVLFFSKWLQLIPLAALGSILMHIGFKLCKPKLFKQAADLGHSHFIPFIVTLLAILFTDLLVGISIGMLTGFGYILKSGLRKSIFVVQEGNSYLIRLMKDVSFLNKVELQQILDLIPQGSIVLVDGTSQVHVDNDVIEVIQGFLDVSKERKITVQILKSSIAIHPFFKAPS